MNMSPLMLNTALKKMKKIEVVAAVIFSRCGKKIFLAKRPDKSHQGGLWEFPGGKVETEETVAQALSRELKEEVAIDILSCQPLLKIEHTYPGKEGSDEGSKTVCLDVFIVDNFIGDPSAQEGQGQGWFELNELEKLDFPEANKVIIEKLLEQSISK